MTNDVNSILSSIEEQASRLNSASDQANSVIAAVEKRLTAFNTGLEYWHPAPVWEGDEEGDLSPNSISRKIIKVLGFARVEGRSCLSIKPIRVERGFYQGDLHAPFESLFSDGPPIALLKASRALRISSLRIIPAFLQGFLSHVLEAVENIESASVSLAHQQDSQREEPGAISTVQQVKAIDIPTMTELTPGQYREYVENGLTYVDHHGVLRSVPAGYPLATSRAQVEVLIRYLTSIAERVGTD